MIFAFCVEDESDEAVACALLSKILGTNVQPDTTPYAVPRGGWQAALRLAPVVARHAHRAGLAGAVFLIDNDGVEPEHGSAHETNPVMDCRLCELRTRANVHGPSRWNRPGLEPLRFFFAVPVQMLETWLLMARGQARSDIERLGKTASERRQLKSLLYGTDAPDRVLMKQVALPIANAVNIELLASKSTSFAYLVQQARASSLPVNSLSQPSAFYFTLPVA